VTHKLFSCKIILRNLLAATENPKVAKREEVLFLKMRQAGQEKHLIQSIKHWNLSKMEKNNLVTKLSEK